MPRGLLIGLLAALALVVPTAEAGAACTTAWKQVGADEVRWHDTLMRSQGVTTDGSSWFFSWQGGMSRTLDNYTPIAAATWPVQPDDPPSVSADGKNHFGPTHIGDLDYDNGLIYAPAEDGGQGLGPVELNDPEYQAPHIALYDAKTLLYTGINYPLDPAIHEAGVPWVAIDARRKQVYTAEWDMPHDRLNIFDLQMRFKRFLPLV